MQPKNLGNLIATVLIFLLGGGIFYTGKLLLLRSNQINTKNQVEALVSASKKDLAAAALNNFAPAVAVAANITQNNMGNLPAIYSVFTHRDPDTAKEIAVLGDFKGNNFKPLVTSDYSYDYTLSPDHKRLYYYKFTEIGQNSVWRVDVANNAQPVHIFDMEATPISFFPSFDGNFFVTLEHEGRNETKIVVYDANGKIIKNLPNMRGESQILGWVDAQNMLILNYPPTNAKRLVIYNITNDMMQEMPITKAKMLGMDTAILSPNGRNVILTDVSNDNLHWKLYRLDLLNQILTPILELDQPVSYYNWSSSGKEVLIASKNELWRCPITGNCTKTILGNLKPEQIYSFWLEDTNHLLMAFSDSDKHFYIWNGDKQADLDLQPLGIKDMQKASFWTK